MLEPEAVVGMPPLLHGASVAVVSGGEPLAPPTGVRPLLDLVVVGGPDAGRSLPLSPPGVVVGRAPGAGLVVHDDGLSRSHVFVEVGPHGVTVEDCGSTNGVTVDGVRVRSVTRVDARSTIVVGSSTLRLRRAGGAGPPVRHPGDGTVRLSPLAGPPSGSDDIEIPCPTGPPERHRARVPWIAAVAPVPVAIALAFFLGPQLLLFAALGPVSLLAGALGDRWGAGRVHRREVAAHAAAVAEARGRLADALRSEAERLDRAHPDPAAVLTNAEQRLPGLWGGPPGSARVRLGSGEVPTRVAWVEGSRRTHPAVARAPLVVDLAEVACLGVVGSPPATDGLLAGLVGQLCTSHPPHDLVVSVASGDPAWSWMERLPHAAGAPVPGDAVGPGPPTPRERGRGSAGPMVVLVVPRPGPETGALVRDALAAGVLVVAGAPSRGRAADGVRGGRGPRPAARTSMTQVPNRWRSFPIWWGRGGPTGCHGPWHPCGAPTPRRAGGCRRGSPSSTRWAAGT